MTSFIQNLLSDTAERLDEIGESLEEYRDWAEGEGYPAIQHKLEEAIGPLSIAAEAARQYADGRLTPKE